MAQPTGSATSEIAALINLIQSSTEDAVDQVKEITTVIGRVSSSVNFMATAMEEQDNATAEIAQNADGAASETEQVARNIGVVRERLGVVRGEAEAA